MEVDDIVPLATLGTTMPNGMTIERRGILGIDSEGMLHAVEERTESFRLNQVGNGVFDDLLDVTSFDVLYHRNVRDDVKALEEVARVLRPGGTLLVRVPAFEKPSRIPLNVALHPGCVGSTSKNCWR